MKVTRDQVRQLAAENENYPEHLVSIPRERWQAVGWDRSARIEVWRSRNFLVQVFAEEKGAQRLTVCRTQMLGNKWRAGITWDDLQRLKRECGRGDRWAVEIFPSEAEVVNVANMRHLWVLPEMPAFAWHSDHASGMVAG